jgi:predicted DNA-binding antitoxin AbrB/MazE fold protein
MSQHIEAVYENGVLRPLQPLHLKESAKVQVSVTEPAADALGEMLDYQLLDYARARSNSLTEVPTLDEVRAMLSRVEGSMAESIIAERGEFWLARYHFDTSAFTKYYHPEIGSAPVSAMVQDPASINQISNLAILETQSAFAMKVRTGALKRSDAGVAMDKVFKDIATGLFFAVRLDASHIEHARALVGKYG